MPSQARLMGIVFTGQKHMVNICTSDPNGWFFCIFMSHLICLNSMTKASFHIIKSPISIVLYLKSPCVCLSLSLSDGQTLSQEAGVPFTYNRSFLSPPATQISHKVAYSVSSSIAFLLYGITTQKHCVRRVSKSGTLPKE